MNNYLCPFCKTALDKSICQEYKTGNVKLYEYIYNCELQACKDGGPQKASRWSFNVWQSRNINYYRAHMPHGNKHYVVQGSSNAWTRLFYDAPNMGAMVRSPIIELPYIAPQEPLLECLESCLKKMMTYIVFK